MSLNPVLQRNFPPIEIPQPLSSANSLSSSNASTSRSGGIEDGEIDIQIRNVVCNYSLPLHIDLKRVAMNSGNVTFDRSRGVLLKQKRNPSCFVKIFSTGKVYIVGCRSEDECKKASRQIARLVQRSMGKLNEVVRIRNYQICNILATCKMPFGIKIEEIARKYPQTTYEPEISVGLVWKFKEPKASLRIHTTGSVTVTGATSEASVIASVQNVYPVLKEFGCPPRHIETLNNYAASSQRHFVATQQRKRQLYGVHPSPHSVEYYVSKRPRSTVYSSNNKSSSVGGGDIGPSSSGIYGNKMYFSDEEDLDEFIEDEEYDESV